MKNSLDALLTALYVDLDDRILPAVGWSRDHRVGRKPVLTDAELVCLAVAQQLLGFASERHWIRYAKKHLAEMPRCSPTFPGSPGTASGYGSRRRCWPR